MTKRRFVPLKKASTPTVVKMEPLPLRQSFVDWCKMSKQRGSCWMQGTNGRWYHLQGDAALQYIRRVAKSMHIAI